MFSHGAEVVRVDFHMHTVKDKEFEFSGSENSFVSAYVEVMRQNNIRIGIITNHNKFDLGEYKALKKEANKSGILILPGVELSVKEGRNGLHTLIVFNPDEWIESSVDPIDNFLCVVFRDIKNRENTNTRCQTDVGTTLTELERYGRDYFVVFAHIEQNNGFLNECNGGLIQSLADLPYFRNRVLGFQKLRNRDKARQLCDWLGYSPAFLDGSDSKSLEDIGKQGGYSHLKLGELSFDAIQYALQDHENRLMGEMSATKHGCIRSVSFQGGKLQGCSINLSPHLNTLIGIRGSGKSSLLEALRYGLQLEPAADKDYKKELVKYVLDSGGKVVISVTDSHARNYTISRINGESPTILDETGAHLDVPVVSVIRNPLYFGQKDLAQTTPGYEFLLLRKLVGTKADIFEENLDKQNALIKESIRKLVLVKAVPGALKDLEEKKRELEHKLKIFNEKGVSDKLKKQSAYTADEVKLQRVINEIKQIAERLNDFLLQYDTSSVSLAEYHSAYNEELFEKTTARLELFATHMQEIAKQSDIILSDIEHLSVLYNELVNARDMLKEEFAEIRREINDDSIDLESFSKYQQESSILDDEINQKKKELQKEEAIRSEILAGLDKRNEVLRSIFESYKSEIEGINARQSELQIRITFKGDKASFLEQLKSTFRGTGITEGKYSAICSEFSDTAAIIRDCLIENGSQLQKLVTPTQYEAVTAKVVDSYGSLVDAATPNLVEIMYHGKPLNQLSMGQRASALV
ncbi:MAG: AAA family ATPase, partial [Clostridiaceae bacterium]|nr:AAA family ATPase [Clostridiaceae bacterium]